MKNLDLIMENRIKPENMCITAPLSASRSEESRLRAEEGQRVGESTDKQHVYKSLTDCHVFWFTFHSTISKIQIFYLFVVRSCSPGSLCLECWHGALIVASNVQHSLLITCITKSMSTEESDCTSKKKEHQPTSANSRISYVIYTHLYGLFSAPGFMVIGKASPSLCAFPRRSQYFSVSPSVHS